MAPQVVLGATMMCSFGVAPSALVVLPVHGVMATGLAANIGDVAPIANIPTFGACSSIANPAVASATAAALGVLTPMPCVPVPVGPWAPGVPNLILQGLPALDMSSKAMCAWAGVIQIVNPGEVTVIDR